jgi:type IV pilus assembly protein PilA
MPKKAFTLVELMIVIAIIGILAVALFPSMSTYMQRARESAAQSDIRTLRLATLKLYADTGR